ncbi:uncharacterized protein PG986_012802 [Apiospora aurea]|uniref:C2H2-type domain-containing protein n=1 Tax=Apiospora aurea TaxID=335848 RepID=A0ABR1Q1H4_9PEZI
MCEVLLEFDDQGCISAIKTTYCTNHPACCSLVGRLSRPVRIEFKHPQQYNRRAEILSPKPSFGSLHHHHHGSSESPKAPSSPASAIFGKHLTPSLNLPVPNVAHRRHVSSRSLLRTVSDVAQQSLKRSISAPQSSRSPSPTRVPSSSTPSTPRLDVTNPDDGYFNDYFDNHASSPAQAQAQTSTNTTSYQSPVPYQANYCICLTFVYRCGHPVDDLKPSSGNGGRASSMKGKHMICGWACTKEGQCRHTRVTHAVQVPLAFGCSFGEGCHATTRDGGFGPWAVVNTTRLCGIGGSSGSELKESAGGGGGVVGKGVMEVLLESQGDVWR